MSEKSLSQSSKLSTDSETKGFDLDTGETWIYPTNLPIRDYQFNIIQEALLKNTLVSLPTGLGKTFIAAVVMFNFYRWYPQSKVIFMAPTRPLVKQQIDACYNIMAIPPAVTAELTGSKLQTSRGQIWKDRRVFFVTPQVLQNDLETVVDLAPQIRCLVFDEAHRAKGNHAYCEVIRRLTPRNKLFRVLALSATPGNSIKDVQEIIQNLQISHLEFRSEESPDVKAYVFERRLETVVVPLGEKLEEIRTKYLSILDKYARVLIKFNVIKGNVGNLSKGRIFMIKKEFQIRNARGGNPNYNEIMRTLLILTSLYHAFEVLISNGLRGFLNFLKNHIEDPLLKSIVELKDMVKNVSDYLGPEAQVQTLPDGSFTGIDTSIKFGHPKFYKLRDLLIEHFDSSEESSRVIVFFEFRECVKEAYALLIQYIPKIRPRVFIGQSDGVTQKMQINVVKNFREGDCNTLLATCIGEEGLDVGEVDLIICFDISNKSPIRMIQRMGRTGRKREGRVIVLVTAGREQQTLKDCMVYKNNIGTFVLNSKQLLQGMYSKSPRMIPSDLNPKCLKLFITVEKSTTSSTKKNGNLKSFLKKMKSPSSVLDYEVSKPCRDDFMPEANFLWNQPIDSWELTKGVNFCNNLEAMRNLQPAVLVKHSSKSELLVNLLQFADSKRFNLPVTQNMNSLGLYTQNRNLKQSDIRNMFAPKSTLSQNSIPSSSPKKKDFVDDLPDDFYSEISTFLSIQNSSDIECRICDNFFDCQKFTNQISVSPPIDSLKEWIQPNLSIFDTMKNEDFDRISADLIPKEIDETFDDLFPDDEDFSKIKFTQIEKDYLQEEKCHEEVEEKSFAFEAPKNLSAILNKTSILEDKPEEWSIEKLLDFFKLSSFQDLFQSCEEEEDDLDKTVIYTQDNLNVILGGNLDSSQIIENPPSPDMFETTSVKSDDFIDNSISPILCTFDRFRTSQVKAKRRIFQDSQELPKKPNLESLKKPRKSIEETETKSDLNSSKYFLDESVKNDISTPVTNSMFEISDICDLSQFGLGAKKMQKPKSSANNNEKKSLDLNINDLCDLSEFGLSPPVAKSQIRTETCNSTPKVQQSSIVQLDDICDLSIFGLDKSTVISCQTTTDDGNLTAPNRITEVTNDGNIMSQRLSLSNKKATQTSSRKLNFTENASNVVVIDLTDSPEKSVKDVDNSSQKENCNLSPIISQNRKLPRHLGKNKSKVVTPNKFNFSISSNNSDDEFEEKTIFAKPKELKALSVRKVSRNNGKVGKKTRKCEFIDDEAVLTQNNDRSISDDEEDGCSQLDSSFIHDETEDFLQNTQVHVEYLKSVKGAQLSRGKFKIPEKPTHNYSNIYSQPVHETDESYLNDTFCVDVEDPEEDEHDLSELELLEMKLKEEKRKRKGSKTSQKSTKRRKLFVLSDDSD